MKKLSKLMDFYYNDIYPHLNSLEAERKKVLFLIKIYLVISIFLGIIIISFSYFNGILQQSLEPIYWAVGLPLAFFTFLYKMAVSKYRSNFKENVIQKIISFLEPNLYYNKNAHILKEEFIWSDLFQAKIDKFEGNDLVEGTLGKSDIRFSDIHALHKTTHNNKTIWHTIFKGQFFIADLNKEFSGRMVVLPDSAEKLLGVAGTFLQKHNPNRQKLIKLDNPEFEKEFVVYADDEISSRYILTQSMMQRILNFKRKSKKEIYLSFRNSKIFIAIASEDMFEPDLFKPLNDFKKIKEYYESFALVVGIVDDLKLNRKIWSKK